MIESDFEISQELKDLAKNIESSRDNFFIAGKAGTGKSTLVKHIRETSKKNLVVLAPTGVAAVNVDGQTIHSFCGLPLSFINKEAIHEHRDKNLYRNLDILIIDEVSMIRADVFDGMDHFFRINRFDKTLPFGGLRVILVGDLYQLSPVVETSLRSVFQIQYKTPYFFSSSAFSQNRDSFKLIELQKIYRQEDERFINILHEARHSQLSRESLNLVNERVITEDEPDESFIILTSRNDMANKINQKRLAKIEAEEKTYQAEVDGQFEEKSYPTEFELKLKPGAKVMFLKNDHHGRWVNGSLGYVSEAEDDFVTVDIDGVTFELKKEVWQKIKYVFNEKTKRVEEEVIGTFIQYPLRLAWAVTIHKSQGMTFDKVVIDLGQGAFSHGQTYVALSRCRTLDGIYLRRPIRQHDFIFDKDVVEFYKIFEKRA
jgi:ATP-dependent exoDNAse (exonuclease V) alpha subunit